MIRTLTCSATLSLALFGAPAYAQDTPAEEPAPEELPADDGGATDQEEAPTEATATEPAPEPEEGPAKAEGTDASDDPPTPSAQEDAGVLEHQSDDVANWVPLNNNTPVEVDADRDRRSTFDTLGLAIEAQWGHRLFFTGPKWIGLTKQGLYFDVEAGLGIRTPLREDGAPVFFDSTAIVGYALGMGRKEVPAHFNVSQSSWTGASGSTTTTYNYYPTNVMRQRNLVVFGGARLMLGSGPYTDDTYSTRQPAYFVLSGGLGSIKTWREVQRAGDMIRTLRGIKGWDLRIHYAPVAGYQEGFTNFTNFGGEFRLHNTTVLGKGSWPMHLGLGIEPGLGLMLKFGGLIPVATPLSGRMGRTGSFER